MSNYNCDYVRCHYDVPAEVGRRVIGNGEPGIIMADCGHYIGVILDSDPKQRIRPQTKTPPDEAALNDEERTLPGLRL